MRNKAVLINTLTTRSKGHNQFLGILTTMAFINELISDVDKARIDWSKFKAYSYSDSHRPWKWTIDRERDVFLVGLALDGYDDTGTRPDIYILYWKGDIIRVEARSNSKGGFETGVDMHWKISKIDIPSHLEHLRQEIVMVLREAIDAHGLTYKREPVKFVRIDIN
jgi:hypothetical protein